MNNHDRYKKYLYFIKLFRGATDVLAGGGSKGKKNILSKEEEEEIFKHYQQLALEELEEKVKSAAAGGGAAAGGAAAQDTTSSERRSINELNFKNLEIIIKNYFNNKTLQSVEQLFSITEESFISDIFTSLKRKNYNDDIINRLKLILPTALIESDFINKIHTLYRFIETSGDKKGSRIGFMQGKIQHFIKKDITETFLPTLLPLIKTYYENGISTLNIPPLERKTALTSGPPSDLASVQHKLSDSESESDDVEGEEILYQGQPQPQPHHTP